MENTFFWSLGFGWVVFATVAFTFIILWLAFHGLRSMAEKALRKDQTTTTDYDKTTSRMRSLTVIEGDGFKSQLLGRMVR